MSSDKQRSSVENRDVLAEILVQNTGIDSYKMLIAVCAQFLHEQPFLSDKAKRFSGQIELISRLAAKAAMQVTPAGLKFKKLWNGRAMYDNAVASGAIRQHWSVNFFHLNNKQIEELMISKRDIGKPIDAVDAELMIMNEEVVHKLWSAANILSNGHHSIPEKPDPTIIRHLLRSIGDLREWATMRQLIGDKERDLDDPMKANAPPKGKTTRQRKVSDSDLLRRNKLWELWRTAITEKISPENRFTWVNQKDSKLLTGFTVKQFNGMINAHKTWLQEEENQLYLEILLKKSRKSK
jgi:hypothetical protein